MPASLGIQVAEPSRRVIAIIGDGSMNHSVTALWTAAQYKIPVIFVVLKNGIYGALRWFADVLNVQQAPGLEVPGIDCVSIARGYGVDALHAETSDQLTGALERALMTDSPTLIEIPTRAEF